ncbi:hypothetical protein J7T55_012041 [Diaporthe amygdali]|uniref:uncharacterized protein n=1 Tax=Phomopsis amygdali TaxID=1214568 RepID=UPI0022FF0E23|nr:uncharacterized protein J7T55_012041 [Diaporthe amygdali]KAJ0123576.1 hypothetical protein J7T55_012041 [Diaporthe amygdali]
MDAITQTFPELLARDLARSQDVFRTRSLTAGAPATSLTLECQPPQVPQRNPGRDVTSTLHRATSETTLYSPREYARARAENARRRQERQQDEWPLRGPGPRYSSLPSHRQDHMFVVEEIRMKQDNTKDVTRLFLNGLDEDWVSDSSADIEVGTSSPSVRTRKQSVTTAATSVEIRSVLGGAAEVCLSPTSSLSKGAARVSGKSGRSWVDLDPDMLKTSGDLDEGAASGEAAEYSDGPQARSAAQANERGHTEQLSHLNVPRRRSSLSHQVTTVVIGEAAHVRVGCAPPKLDLEPASKPPTPPSPRKSSPPPPPSYQNQHDWDTNEAVSCSIAPTSRHRPIYEPQYALTATSSYQLRPPSPLPDEAADDALDANQHSQQHPNLLHKLRKTRSHSRMPIITQVQSWLDSSAATAHPTTPTHFTNSPTSTAPIGSVRVAAEVLENLRISVGNFPDTMLRTSSLTVQTIRSYSRKLRRGGTSSGDRGFSRDSDDYALTAFDAPTMDSVPGSLERKSSFGNLKFKKLSLRGKKLHLSSRQGSSHTSPFLKEDDDFWPPVDHHNISMRSNTPPSRKSSDVSACVGALRSIFPNGTDYLLDGLYAHLIAYNYINSLCGAMPHLLSSPGHPGLRSRPSMTFPPGVTSRADLALQDRDDVTIRELQDDVATTASTAVVPKKAASLLGLGATHMGKPVRPRPGTLAGRKDKQRKTTPPAASFSASLESDSAMRDLRDAIASNIKRLVETVKQCSPTTASRDSDEDSEDAAILGQNGRELEPVLLRALCEVVRCYEELS